MSEEDLENTEKTCECDDPCDDCTDINMANLTGWIVSNKKESDENVDKK